MYKLRIINDSGIWEEQYTKRKDAVRMFNRVKGTSGKVTLWRLNEVYRKNYS